MGKKKKKKWKNPEPDFGMYRPHVDLNEKDKQNKRQQRKKQTKRIVEEEGY